MATSATQTADDDRFNIPMLVHRDVAARPFASGVGGILMQQSCRIE
jgi:hypothetical protein